MHGRQAPCRQPAAAAAGDLTAVPPRRPSAIAAAALSVAGLLVVAAALWPPIADAARSSTSGLMTSSSDTRWRTMDEPPLSIVPRRSAQPHFRHRHHRHRHRDRSPPVSAAGLDAVRPHSAAAGNATVSGRRRAFRHVDAKGTSGDSDVFKVVVDPRPSQSSDPFRLAAGSSGDVYDLSDYFRFCRHRLVSSALDPVRCGDDPARRCLLELAALDDEAEFRFQQFVEVMTFFDCGHAYSLASDCSGCKVRNILSISSPESSVNVEHSDFCVLLRTPVRPLRILIAPRR